MKQFLSTCVVLAVMMVSYSARSDTALEEYRATACTHSNMIYSKLEGLGTEDQDIVMAMLIVAEHSVLDQSSNPDMTLNAAKVALLPQFMIGIVDINTTRSLGMEWLYQIVANCSRLK